MKQIVFLFLLFLVSVNESVASDKIRVACIGNSITYGAGIVNREKNCYPTQLQAYLGDQYEVRNLGVSGSTAIEKGDYPYRATSAYQEIFRFQPDILLIKLGTNDTKPQNWRCRESYLKDYQALIDTCRTLKSNPRIILLTPVRCYLPESSEINAKRIEQDIRPWVETLAFKNQLEIINLFNVFGKQWREELFPDKLHPSSIGAGMIARKIGVYLLQSNVSSEASSQHKIIAPKAVFNFHGYKGVSFENEGVNCLLVQPHRVAKGKPWVIRARFWGHEPQTDVALLENGFHIAYCDVADLYGAPDAVKRWNGFYKQMRKAGFHKKVVLEGMSRGGLIVYNWAAANPEKVACIYADAPVLDFKSWPLGTGKSEGSDTDANQLMKAYGFNKREDALRWIKNPINHARILAKHKIPILHVVGDADEVVPVAENTAIFEKRMADLNFPIQVIHKPGVGHHPHSLSNPQAIVDFILKSTGRKVNLCTLAVPGNEFRSGAGWKSTCEWHTVSDEISQILQGKQLKLLLLGNSITQGWGGSRKSVTYKPGKEIMDRKIGANLWESAGISGDRVQNLLWRVKYGSYTGCEPENIVISIGVNNLIGETDTAEEVASGIITLARETIIKFPNSRIILLGPLPAGKESLNPVRIQYNRIQQILNATRIKQVQYVDPTSWFVANDGSMRDGLYSGDYIHLSGEGYQVWADQIAKLVSEK